MKRTLFLLVASTAAACDLGESSEQAAYSEAMMASEARQVVSDTVAFHEPGRPLDPMQLVADMQAFIEEGSDCAAISADGEDIFVDFGDAGCAFQGRTYTGAVSASFIEGDGSAEMSMIFASLSDGIVTLDGVADAVLSDDARQISAVLDIAHEEGAGCMEGEEMAPPEGERPADSGEGEMAPPPRPPSAFTLTLERTEAPIDGSFDSGVVINADQQMSAEQGDAAITEAGVEILAGEVVPQAGSVVHDGPMGAATMRFERLSADAILVTVDGPMGEDTFEVDPATGARL